MTWILMFQIKKGDRKKRGQATLKKITAVDTRLLPYAKSFSFVTCTPSLSRLMQWVMTSHVRYTSFMVEKESYYWLSPIFRDALKP
jgi:hypothetical protein